MKQNPIPPHLTHATGTPVTDNLNIQTAGPRGPALLQDPAYGAGVAQAIARLAQKGSAEDRKIA
jgi:catalase